MTERGRARLLEGIRCVLSCSEATACKYFDIPSMTWEKGETVERSEHEQKFIENVILSNRQEGYYISYFNYRVPPNFVVSFRSRHVKNR